MVNKIIYMKNIIITLKRKHIFAIFCCLLVIFCHLFFYFNVEKYKKIVNTISDKIFNSFNNERDATNDDGDIYFVFANFSNKISSEDKPKLHLPSSEEFDLTDGVFTFNLKSQLIVKCAGEGIVTKVGYLENGLKFVEVRHSGGYITRYENLKIVGVGNNFLVKKIHIIGRASEDYPFIFKVILDDKIVSNFTENEGVIKWDE